MNVTVLSSKIPRINQEWEKQGLVDEEGNVDITKYK